jgi:hypothetical protein
MLDDVDHRTPYCNFSVTNHHLSPIVYFSYYLEIYDSASSTIELTTKYFLFS